VLSVGTGTIPLDDVPPGTIPFAEILLNAASVKVPSGPR
jgi:hypothetical protein